MAITANTASPARARRAFPRDDTRLTRLHAIVDAHSLLRGAFQLTGGGTSNYFFQLRQTTMHAEGACLIGELIVDFMRRENIGCIGGLEMGAVPIVAAAAAVSFQKGYPVSAFFVRKQTKAHGAKELVDGYIGEGVTALMVDDVTTTAGSTLRAVEAVASRCPVTKALAVVDREEGAAENLAAHGIQLYYLLTRSDFEID